MVTFVLDRFDWHTSDVLLLLMMSTWCCSWSTHTANAQGEYFQFYLFRTSLIDFVYRCVIFIFFILGVGTPTSVTVCTVTTTTVTLTCDITQSGGLTPV